MERTNRVASYGFVLGPAAAAAGLRVGDVDLFGSVSSFMRRYGREGATTSIRVRRGSQTLDLTVPKTLPV